MSSKRKWDQAAPEVDPEQPSKATKTEDTKTASEAAATAAAIAAKIAAQFANGGTGGGGKDPYDGEFTHDIDINDLRNRYLLTRGSTQQQVRTPKFLSSHSGSSSEGCSLFLYASLCCCFLVQDSRGDWGVCEHEGNVVS
jgi:hypothetical protein